MVEHQNHNWWWDRRTALVLVHQIDRTGCWYHRPKRRVLGLMQRSPGLLQARRRITPGQHENQVGTDDDNSLVECAASRSRSILRVQVLSSWFSLLCFHSHFQLRQNCSNQFNSILCYNCSVLCVCKMCNRSTLTAEVFVVRPWLLATNVNKSSIKCHSTVTHFHITLWQHLTSLSLQSLSRGTILNFVQTCWTYLRQKYQVLKLKLLELTNLLCVSCRVGL